MSFERIHQYTLASSHRKSFLYDKFGIGALSRQYFIDPSVARSVIEGSSRAEEELQSRAGGREYLYNGVPLPTILSLGKATAATRTLTNHYPGLDFAKGRRLVLTADDWVWGAGPSEETITEVFGKQSTFSDGYLHSAFGITDAYFDYVTGKTALHPWIITCCLGLREDIQIPNNGSSGIAGGIDIIEAIQTGLIYPRDKYKVQAQSFKPVSLEEAEKVLEGEQELVKTDSFERVHDFTDMATSHPMFDRYLRRALMNITI